VKGFDLKENRRSLTVAVLLAAENRRSLTVAVLLAAEKRRSLTVAVLLAAENRRSLAFAVKNLRSLAVAVLLALPVFGDGSVVLLRQTVQPFDITVFAEHAPLTVGQSNLSVMVQRAADHSDVPDAHVTLRFQRNEGSKIVEIVAPATHAKATNKLLYGAMVTLPNEGYWKFTTEVSAQGANVTLPAQFAVGPAEPPLKEKWPLIVFVPVAIVLFILNRRLKRRWRVASPPARP
jgi:hypothetical protein